jgi:hypothetical protein
MDTLQRIPSLSLPHPARPETVAALLRACRNWLVSTWHTASMSDDERYLASSCDLDQLERRMRRIEKSGSQTIDLIG